MLTASVQMRTADDTCCEEQTSGYGDLHCCSWNDVSGCCDSLDEGGGGGVFDAEVERNGVGVKMVYCMS